MLIFPAAFYWFCWLYRLHRRFQTGWCEKNQSSTDLQLYTWALFFLLLNITVTPVQYQGQLLSASHSKKDQRGGGGRGDLGWGRKTGERTIFKEIRLLEKSLASFVVVIFIQHFLRMNEHCCYIKPGVFLIDFKALSGFNIVWTWALTHQQRDAEQGWDVSDSFHVQAHKMYLWFPFKEPNLSKHSACPDCVMQQIISK